MNPFSDAPYTTHIHLNLTPSNSQNALEFGFAKRITEHNHGNSLY